MAKWYGKIGYAVTAEVEPGCWENAIVERSYFGDLTRDRYKRQSSDKVNDDITLSNMLSIIADPWAYQNCSTIAYVEIAGAKWKVTDVEIQSPRLILSIGGVYNG